MIICKSLSFYLSDRPRVRIGSKTGMKTWVRVGILVKTKVKVWEMADIWI